MAANTATAAVVEQRLRDAGIQLTMGGEPTLVPLHPDGAEWNVSADGPTKLTYARALAGELRRRAWPGSSLIHCPGKRYDGEVNPRWVLRLITGLDGQPLVHWPQHGNTSNTSNAIPSQQQLLDLIHAVGADLRCPLHPLPLRDPLQSDRQIWAVPLSCDQGLWKGVPWPLPEPLRQLTQAPGPAGLRLPLEHFPDDALRQVLTLESDPEGWTIFLPPLEREPLLLLLRSIASHSQPWSEPELSGVLPWDAMTQWQVLGITADPGVLEVNLPVCHTWQDYADWMHCLEQAATRVGLRSWRFRNNRQESTGGGNHLLLGGPNLDDNPFFSRPAWLVGLLRYWQHHPSLAYLFNGRSVGPASQSPRPDEGSANRLDLQLALHTLERLPDGDQRVAIGETLRHLHADRSGNTHRSEISLDKFWNPAWSAGCQGLLEFRAIETLPDHHWSSAVALLFRALAVRLLEPHTRPVDLHPWGESLHDRALLPSELWRDLETVLADLTRSGIPLDQQPFRAIWDWRFPVLLHWCSDQGQLWVRQALEPWPLLCDTPVEGGSTSRFVDSSLRRFEVTADQTLQKNCHLVLQGRALPWPHPEQPLAVRYRQEALFPCLHPCLPADLPLCLELRSQIDDTPIAVWHLATEAEGFLASDSSQIKTMPAARIDRASPLPSVRGGCTLDLRL